MDVKKYYKTNIYVSYCLCTTNDCLNKDPEVSIDDLTNMKYNVISNAGNIRCFALFICNIKVYKLLHTNICLCSKITKIKVRN